MCWVFEKLIRWRELLKSGSRGEFLPKTFTAAAKGSWSSQEKVVEASYRKVLHHFDTVRRNQVNKFSKVSGPKSSKCNSNMPTKLGGASALVFCNFHVAIA